MAIARKCDRCGKLYEHYPTDDNCEDGEQHNSIRKVYRDVNYKLLAETKPLDLCPDCMRAFNEFMSEFSKGEKENK